MKRKRNRKEQVKYNFLPGRQSGLDTSTGRKVAEKVVGKRGREDGIPIMPMLSDQLDTTSVFIDPPTHTEERSAFLA
jgi:hypothetical protein